MTAKAWLRIAAGVSLLFAVGHTFGSLKYWSPMGDNPVLQTMRDTHFQVMGVSRSYFDFYMAFGYCLSVAGFMQSILLWQLADLLPGAPGRVRPMIAVIAAAVAVSGIISWLLILPVPAYFSLALLVPLLLALINRN